MTSTLELDIFRANKQSVDVQKIVFKLWENNRNADVLNQLSEVLCKFMDEKKVFTEIEFYLPQIAHLVIHMEQNVHSAGLETLAMVICQTSMHCALQFSFMLIAAMEDYQPEIAKNKKNPTANAFYFARCARLLQDVERAVIYGSPNLSSSEERVWKNRATSIDGSQDLRTFKRSELAHQLSVDVPHSVDSVLNGVLLFKRVERKSMFHSKQWHERYFVVDQRVLLCFNDKDAATPKRAISLQNCVIVVDETNAKYGDTCFEVVNEANGIRYLLRAKDTATRNRWVEFLNREISGAPVLSNIGATSTSSESPPSSSTDNNSNGHSDVQTNAREQQNQLLNEANMTPAQRRRFRYFQQMRVFITNLTNICERLRFKERDVRKYFLKRDMAELVIPPFAYLPLCNSVDGYCSIRKALPKECHAFTTKARVPALMLFEIERHPRNLDVATFLNAELELHSDSQVYLSETTSANAAEVNHLGASNMDANVNAASTSQDHQDDIDAPITPLSSAFSDRLESFDGVVITSSQDANAGLTQSGKRCYWSMEGTGIERLRSAATSNNNNNNNNNNTNNSNGRPKSADIGDITLSFGHESSSVVAANVTLPHSGVLGETFAGKAYRLQRTSNYGHLPGWSIGGLIAKSNDDVRQEVFVIQLMTYYQRAFAEANIPVWMHTYKIVSTSKSTGLIELIPNATSLDGLKKSEGYPGKLRLWYEQKFGRGHTQSDEFKTAIENYIASQAAYSIVTYLLAIKDRHNGNIMIDKDGHIVHIDFGFVFGLAPGKQFSMETAPWKLNAEFVEVMGGPQSPLYKDYRQRCIQAFNVARRHAKAVLTLLEIMQAHSNYPAFRYNGNAIRDFRARLFLDRPDSDLPAIIDQLLARSYKNSGTDLYDQFQLATNGIAV